MPTFEIITYEPATYKRKYKVKAANFKAAKQAILNQDGNCEIELLSSFCHEDGKIKFLESKRIY